MKHDTEEENDHPDLSKVISKVNEHVDTRLEYMRLLVSEKIAILVSKIASTSILLVLFLLFFFFLNVAAAMWIGKHYNDYAIGFGVLSGFYLLVMLVFLALRRTTIEKKIQDGVVKSLFTENEEDEEDED